MEINSLTGLYFSHSFFHKVQEFLDNTKPTNYCVVAIDLEHFRLFNKLYGRKQGDYLLKTVASILKSYAEIANGLAGYLGGDNFGILLPYDETILKPLRQKIAEEVKIWSNTVGFLPAFGIYPITDSNISSAEMYDLATIALSHVIGNYTKRHCIYSPDMEETVEEELRLLTEIEEALQRDEFTFFIQPQCDISSGKIVGGESLVRWRHSTKGLIPPGVFVPVLEKNGFIASLDRYVWEKVCQWLRSWIDRGYHPVPISINVSRIDIFSMDVPTYLNNLIQKYELPPSLLKVEITESAYTESSDQIIRTVKQLRDSDFLVMMDDFGSGYSSLNMLNSISVDVLKIDMRFLDINEQDEEKGIGILESVINMARQMRIPIVVEGVENQKQENFLLKMGCRYTQGYYYYKPMPIEDFENLIINEHNLDFNGIWCRQIESMHIREFLDQNLFNDTMVNNILGAAAFYDMYENNIEITRVNEQYFKLAGITQQEDEDYNKRFWNHVRDDDRQLLFSIFGQAYENPANGAQGYIHFIRDDGETLWIFFRVFFLREKDGHKLFYGSLTDMSHLRRKQALADTDNPEPEEVTELTSNQLQYMEKYYGNLPCGFGVGKLILDASGNPIDYDIVYANHEANRVSGGDKGRLRYLMLKTFSHSEQELLTSAYQVACNGEHVDLRLYSPLSCRYLHLYMYQYQYGYVCCMFTDETHSQIYESTLDHILHSYREVYFIHLADNYCRMIYPDDNHMLERGEYDGVVNRHFETGRICPYDEKNVRKFLSLDNLKEKLQMNETIEYKYKRKIHEKSEEWCLTTITVCEKKNGMPKTAILTIRSIEALMREKEDNKRKNMAEMLANMGDGFFIYSATGSEKVLYVNPTVIDIYGCSSPNEFYELTGRSFRGMVHPDDLERIEWEIDEQIKHSEKKMDFIRYRIIRKDGEVRWVDDCGHLERNDTDSELFYVIISDITDSMSDTEKQKLIEQSKAFH